MLLFGPLEFPGRKCLTARRLAAIVENKRDTPIGLIGLRRKRLYDSPVSPCSQRRYQRISGLFWRV